MAGEQNAEYFYRVCDCRKLSESGFTARLTERAGITRFKDYFTAISYTNSHNKIPQPRAVIAKVRA
jgi:hypothetical protein